MHSLIVKARAEKLLVKKGEGLRAEVLGDYRLRYANGDLNKTIAGPLATAARLGRSSGANDSFGAVCLGFPRV